MLKRNETSTWGNLRVSHKLTLIPVMFITAIAGILGYTVLTAQDQKTDAYVIFMASRQRMLNQRQALEAILTSQGLTWNASTLPADDKEAKLATLRNTDFSATRKLLFESLDSLTNGGQVIDLFTGELRLLPPAPTVEIKAKLTEQKSLLSRYSEIIDRLVTLKPGDADYKSALYDLLEQNYKVELNCIVVAKLLADNSLGKITSMIWQETVIGLVVGVLGLAFSMFVTRGIVRPLGNVVDLAQSIAEGDLRCQKLANPSRDEVGQLATVFNQMLDSLRDLAGQTTSVTENLNASAAEIMASTQQQVCSTKEQATAIQQITSTMAETSQSGAEIIDRARQVATSAEAASTTSKSGIESVQNTNATMQAIREQVEEVAENIVALSEKAQAVGEIIATVNEIAEQSNLLALNATIEAVSAGSEGSRFSVVANEMKNLADQAKECTVQVRAILGEIQKGINTSVMLTEEAVKRVESGKKQTDVSERTIFSVSETTENSIQAFQQIIGAANQQQIGFEQVTQGMQSIRQAAEQTAASTAQHEKAVANLTALSQQLRRAVSNYKLN
jgi:methyl-accepting chemotaxis protein